MIAAQAFVKIDIAMPFMSRAKRLHSAPVQPQKQRPDHTEDVTASQQRSASAPHHVFCQNVEATAMHNAGSHWHAPGVAAGVLWVHRGVLFLIPASHDTTGRLPPALLRHAQDNRKGRNAIQTSALGNRGPTMTRSPTPVIGSICLA